MFQIYLLAVIVNILAGMALSGSFLNRRISWFSEYMDFMNNASYRVILGIVNFLVAIINLFRIYPGDIPVIGDFLPSLAGFITGIILVVEFIVGSRTKDAATENTGFFERVNLFFKPYTTVIGISSIVIGILHALLPRIPLL